jgi:hypothetical protein
MIGSLTLNHDSIDRSKMTNPEILKLAETCGFTDASAGATYWECWEHQLLRFALLIHEDGYNKGYDDSKSSSFKGFHNCLDD